VRAILLDSLAQAAASDDRIGVAFAASARNALPLMEIGDEKSIWADVVTTIESKVDSRAEAEWATPETIVIPSFSFAPPQLLAPQVASPKLDRQSFVAKFQSAAGPQANNAATNGNPHWPQANSPWVTEFGTRITEAVADMVEAVAAKISIGDINLSEPFGQLASAVTGYVEGALTAFSGATAGLQRRTGLLWWKEALYSPSARTSYRTLAPEAAAALMAFDLYNQIPTFSPASVAVFLHEAVLLLPSAGETTTRSIGELAAMARQSSEFAPLRTAASALFSEPQGRGPLLALIGHPHSAASLSN
jgi:hypothetical protein